MAHSRTGRWPWWVEPHRDRFVFDLGGYIPEGMRLPTEAALIEHSKKIGPVCKISLSSGPFEKWSAELEARFVAEVPSALKFITNKTQPNSSGITKFVAVETLVFAGKLLEKYGTVTIE